MMLIDNNLRETEGSVEAFCPADEFIGNILRFSALLDFRRQVRAKGVDGYYLKFTDTNGLVHRIEINAKGKLSHRPKGMFDLVDDLLTELI